MPTIKQVGGYFDSVYLARWSLPCLGNNESRSSTIGNLRPRASCNPKAVGVQRGEITIRVPQSPEPILVSAVSSKVDNLRRRDGLEVEGEGEGEKFDGLEAEAEAEAEAGKRDSCRTWQERVMASPECEITPPSAS